MPEFARIKKHKYQVWSILILVMLISIAFLFQHAQQQKTLSIVQKQEEQLLKATNLFTLKLGNLEKIIRLLYVATKKEYEHQPPTDENWLRETEHVFYLIGSGVENVSQLRWLAVS